MQLLYIDLFCGAGGTSTGVELARVNGAQCAKVIACVNHDANAIASHAANHPDALHFTEDIRILDLVPLVAHVTRMRMEHPNAKVVLWASLECTNFSKAKGGQSRDADSRTLAEHLFRYIEAIDADYIKIENVEEFMSWGDLDENGKPISKDAGRSYRRWVKNVEKYGYIFDYCILNSADFGAYTSRKRFFGWFAKVGMPMIWATPTHSKHGSVDLFGELHQWRPVRDVLDLNDEGNTVFDRKKSLVDATLERIHAGLVKFVAGGKEHWLLKYNSVNGKTGTHIPPSIDDSCPTVACQSRLGIVKACFLTKYFGGHPESKVQSVTTPCGTLTTKDRYSKIDVHFLSKQFSGHPASKNISIDAPAGAITAIDHHAFVSAHSFISAYYGNGFNSSVKESCPTVTTHDRFSLVTPRFMDMQYGNGTPSSIATSALTLTTNPKHQLVSCKQWVLNPQFASAGGSVAAPIFTLIARMDKRPPSLVIVSTDTHKLPSFIRIDGENIIYEIYANDTAAMVKIKEFMALYGLIDIKMRMLNIPELKRIMGFPEGYVLIGTQAEQKKFIGNAVEVNIARVDCEATCIALMEMAKVA